MGEEATSAGLLSKDDGRVAVQKKNPKDMTKRQKRKQPNDQHKWVQHPKIQSMEKRQKAYIRVAGLGGSSSDSSSTKKKAMIDPKLDLMSPEVKFGRLLGGTDQRKRHSAILKLKAYLKARCDINNAENGNGGISELDLMKLWKALWYTLFMADKVPVQDELSKHLAELLWCVAGTEEEDEYAAQAYMDMCAEEDAENAGDDDDDDVIMEEVHNSLGLDYLQDDNNDGDDDDDDDSDNSEEEEEEDNDDEDENDNSEEDVDAEQEMEQEEMGGEGDEENEIDDSEIPHCRGAHLASLFIRVFFRTLRREWGNMDKYRVDKFYTLIRLYIHEVFKYMALRSWNVGIIRLFNDVIFDEVLKQTPNGLRYHLIDIVVDELAKVNANDAPIPLTEATYLDVLEPYFAMCQTGGAMSQSGGGGDDTIQTRVMEKVLEKFLSEYSVVSDRAIKEREKDDDDDDGNGFQQKKQQGPSLVLDQVHVGTVGQFIFELASHLETKDQYRKSLYDMHKAYTRRVKKVGTDVELFEAGGGEGEEESEEYYDEDDVEMDQDGEPEGDQEEVSPESQEEEDPPEEEAPTSKKKKNKKRKAEEEEKEVKDQSVEPAKRGKKKKKKRGSSKNESEAAGSVTQLVDSTSNIGEQERDENREEVITISLSEQKRAEAKSKKSKKKKKASEEDEEEHEKSAAKKDKKKSEKHDKRVKFGNVNHSKSYKASMKALVSSAPKSPKISPDKSILLNKGRTTKISKKSGKESRKRAVNYF